MEVSFFLAFTREGGEGEAGRGPSKVLRGGGLALDGGYRYWHLFDGHPAPRGSEARYHGLVRGVVRVEGD